MGFFLFPLQLRPCALSVQCTAYHHVAYLMQALQLSCICWPSCSAACKPIHWLTDLPVNEWLICLPDCRIAPTQSKLLQQVESAWRICYVPGVFCLVFLANLCLPQANKGFQILNVRYHAWYDPTPLTPMSTFAKQVQGYPGWILLDLFCVFNLIWLCFSKVHFFVHCAVYWGWSTIPPTLALHIVWCTYNCAPITSALSRSPSWPTISTLTLHVCCTGGVFQMLQWPAFGYCLLQQFSCCHKRFQWPEATTITLRLLLAASYLQHW